MNCITIFGYIAEILKIFFNWSCELVREKFVKLVQDVHWGKDAMQRDSKIFAVPVWGGSSQCKTINNVVEHVSGAKWENVLVYTRTQHYTKGKDSGCESTFYDLLNQRAFSISMMVKVKVLKRQCYTSGWARRHIHHMRPPNHTSSFLDETITFTDHLSTQYEFTRIIYYNMGA